MYKKVLSIAALIAVTTCGGIAEEITDNEVKKDELFSNGSRILTPKGVGGGGNDNGLAGSRDRKPLALPNFPNEFMQKEECPPNSGRKCTPPRDKSHGDSDKPGVPVLTF